MVDPSPEARAALEDSRRRRVEMEEFSAQAETDVIGPLVATVERNHFQDKLKRALWGKD